MILCSDLAEVLISGIYGTQDIVKERYGLEVGQQFWTKHNLLWRDFRELLRGEITEYDYWQRVFRGERFSFSIEDIEQIFSENMAHVIPGTAQVYQRIISYPQSFAHPEERVQGMPPIAIVSDHIFERITEIQHLHPWLWEIADRHIWSCYARKIKSDAGFFDEILREHLAILPEEAVFIDDRADNVAAAQAAGIKSILFLNAGQLERNLAALGFEFAPNLNSGSAQEPSSESTLTLGSEPTPVSGQAVQPPAQPPQATA